MKKSDKAHLHSMWELMPPETQKALQEAVEALAGNAARAENAVSRHCPRCGGPDTTDCQNVKGIADPTVALCITCGYLWCLECETHLISRATCGHWRICSNCGERKDELGYCRTVPWECPHIRDWLEKSSPRA